MSFFDSVLINLILVLFPLAIYLIFVAYSNNLQVKTKNIVLDMGCISMIYLLIKYSFYYNDINIIFFLNLPLIILYLKRRNISSLLCSLIIVIYYFYMYKFSIYFLIIEYIVYYVLFDLYKDNVEKTLNIFIFLKGITLSIELIFIIPYESSLYKLILEIFLNLCMFYLISILTIKMLDKGEEIVSYNQLLKELEKEKLLKNSLFKITHEVKNPIAVCKGYLSMMNYNDIDKVKKYNEIIKSELNRTLDIMDNFSEYTKISIKKDLMDLNMLIEDAVDTMKFILKEKNIELKYYNSDDLYINGDYDRLKQVIVNMVKNAVEAIGEDGLIEISLKKDKRYVTIMIKDNGCGMTLDELKKITELFYTSKSKGCGIGVTLSLEIIKLHDGVIKYESILNEGTIVKIKLPVFDVKF